ncbi:hypothetical protein AV530_007767 [Patagioenas fasciata monilis]|uniref:Uncharacterized protein n=1 Tax=Patagioenas fasciata monilis TaxID=372326 RepID=A0A1V4JZ18_PATFA|nr:hypothetical protein AV530_007767 [Patagioenas fasciata monilis]
MEVKTSFSNASRIPETVSRLINEEFVLVYQQSEDASAKYEELQLKVFSNGYDQLEMAMEEILSDSEKDQDNFPALREGSSEAGDGSAGQTNLPSLHLVLDPSTTGY